MMCMRDHAAAFVVAGLLIALAPLASGVPWEICSNSTGNYTANSTYQANLGLVAAALPTNVSTSSALFAVARTGVAPNEVHAVGVCRGDQDASACHACITSAFVDAQKLCPYDKGIAIFYDICLVGFSDRNLLVSPTNSDEEEVQLYNAQNITAELLDGMAFNTTVYELLEGMSEYVGGGAVNLTRRFVTGAIPFDATYPNIYAMAWCTPDLTPWQCRACLASTIAEMAQVFIPNTKGARITGLRCSLRYEVYPFYNGAAMLQLGEAPAGNKRNETGKILAIVLPTVVALLAIILFCMRCWRRRTRSKKSLLYASQMEDIETFESLLIDLSTLRIATDNFAANNKLGEGGFGAVYKGSLPNGQEIAVKRLSQISRQGIGELRNELVLVSKLQHKNLVRLVGVCLQDEETLIVYEYMPNTSLDNFLFDSEKRKELDWGKRLAIINGIARGLQYLHEDSLLKIVHRDLKASNVLLDADMYPKISDFGLARLFGGNKSQDTTNRVVGTYGYMAPEYALRGQYSIKSDIYSFGVMILEILTGRRNSDSFKSDQLVDLPSLIWEHWTMERVMEMIDPYLMGDSTHDVILRCLHIGLSCVQLDPRDRPTMSTISIMLNSNTIPSKAPSRPAFYIEMSGTITSGFYSQPNPGANNESTSKSTVMSTNKLSITDYEPR